MAFWNYQTSAEAPPPLYPYVRTTERSRALFAGSAVAVVGLMCIPFGFFFAVFVPYLFLFFVLPLALLAIIVIWALPDTDNAPTGLLPPLIYLFITALFLWPNYLAISLPGLPWITMIRATTFPLAFIFLICASVSSGFRNDLAHALNAAPIVWKAMAAFAVIQVISIAFSKNTTQSFQTLLSATTSWTIVLFVSCYVFLKPGRVRRWAILLWIMSLILGSIALIERNTHQVLWGPHIPDFLRVGDEVVQRILAGASRSTTGQYRTQSTFSTALGLSEYCALTLPFVLHFMATTRNIFVRTIAICTVPFLLFVIINTDARLGLLGFFLSLMVYLFLWGVLRWTRDKASLIGPAVVLVYPAIFCAAVASTFIVGRIKNKVWGTGQYAASNEGRMAQVRAGTPKVLDHPFGHGIGMGGDALGYTNKAGVQTVDSYLLQIGLDMGLFGLIAYSVLLIAPIFFAIKYSFKPAARDNENNFLVPLAGSLVNFTAIKFIFANDDNHPLMFMMVGIVIALVCRVRDQSEPGWELAARRAARPYPSATSRTPSIPAAFKAAVSSSTARPSSSALRLRSTRLEPKPSGPKKG